MQMPSEAGKDIKRFQSSGGKKAILAHLELQQVWDVGLVGLKSLSQDEPSLRMA